MANRDLKAVVYTDDAGGEFVTKMDATIFAQGVVGGADYTGSPALNPMPKGLIPRAARVSLAGNKRNVICLTPAATLFTGAATAVNLQVLGAAAAEYTRFGRRAERAPRAADPTG